MDNKKIILIVDDSPENLRALGEILEHENEIRIAFNGQNAIESVQYSIPDLILLDIMMPGMGGYEVCRHLKSIPEFKMIPIIFISALGETEQKIKAFSEGGVDYITKPFQADEVLVRVRTHLQLSELEVYKRELADRARAEEILRESEARFATLFEHSPTSIWEEDFSEFKCYLNKLQNDGIHDWRSYFDNHLDQIRYCSSLIKIVDMNNTSVKFFEIENKNDIPKNLLFFFTNESLLVFKEELIALAEGKTHFECEISMKTLAGRGKILFLNLSVVPGCEQTLKRILISFIDITERKQAEDAMRFSEAQLSNALQIAHAGHWEYNVARDIFTFNDNFYKIFRTTAKEMGGYEMSSNEYARRFCHPDDAAMVAKETQDAIVAADPEYSRQVEHRILYADGEVGYIAVRFFIIKDEKGQTVKTYGVNQDITERKRAEEVLRSNEENLQTLFNAINESLCFLESNGLIITANKTFADRLGRSISECIGKSIYSLVPKEIAERRKIIIEKVINTGKPETFEDERQGLWLSHIIWPVLNTICTVNRLVIYAMDITNRKRTEQSLKESEEKYRILVEQTTDGILIIDSIGNYIDANSGICKMLGYTKEEILSMNMRKIVHANDIPKQTNDYLRVSKGENVITEHQIMSKNGKFISTELNIKMLPDGRFCAFVRDVSERKKTEAEHLRLQNLESLGVLAGGIAHDFNNILSSILGQSSLVVDDVPEGEVKDSLISIERAARRAIGLTNQLLTFAKGGKPDKRTINLQKLIQDTAKFSLSGSNVEVEYGFRESLKMEADYSQISQVIQNLVINAKQAMPNGGSIKILTEDYLDLNDNKYVKISVEDHGMGIQKEYIEKIFDPYFTSKQSGSGLGLSVCHSIINRHAGKIYVSSELGQGTTFTILLPSTEKETVSEAGTEKLINRKFNILVMDDEEEVRDLLSSMLKKTGHIVKVSKEGGDTIRMYKDAKEHDGSFDLVFLDLTVKGGLGGLETVKLLRELDPNIKVIVSSGYADSSVASYKEDGFDGMLKKPYTKNELNEAIFEVMNK